MQAEIDISTRCARGCRPEAGQRCTSRRQRDAIPHGEGEESRNERKRQKRARGPTRRKHSAMRIRQPRRSDQRDAEKREANPGRTRIKETTSGRKGSTSTTAKTPSKLQERAGDQVALSGATGWEIQPSGETYGGRINSSTSKLYGKRMKGRRTGSARAQKSQSGEGNSQDGRTRMDRNPDEYAAGAV